MRCGRIWPRLGIVAAQGREGLKQLLAIIADKKDARLPLDAHASLIVLAAQLQALHTMIGSIEKRLWCSIAPMRRASDCRASPGSASSARAPLPPLWQTRRHFGRVVILLPGLGSSRAKIQPSESRNETRGRAVIRLKA